MVTDPEPALEVSVVVCLLFLFLCPRNETKDAIWTRTSSSSFHCTIISEPLECTDK